MILSPALLHRPSRLRLGLAWLTVLTLTACSPDGADQATGAGGASVSGSGASGGSGAQAGGMGGMGGSGAAGGAGGSGSGHAAYPNMPDGSWSVIGSFDGSVEEEAGHAFGIADFGGWNQDSQAPADQIEVVADPTNPTGSGYALRFRFSQNLNPRSGSAAAATFSAGTQQELYVMQRILLEPGGWDFGTKFIYIGADPAARGVGSPTQYYNDRPSGGNPERFRLLTQNNGSVVIIDSSDAPPTGNGSEPLVQGEWLSIEHHLVAESTPGAGDGSAYVWINGTLVGQAEGTVAWNASGPPGFNGMQWYGDTNSVSTESYYRVGELFIAGR